MTINVQNINIQMPNQNCNYCKFDMNKVDRISNCKENAIPYVKEVLTKSKNEKKIVETLYIADKMIDKGTKGMDKLYPYFAKFNDTNSANVQTFLAGIYRKAQVPDAFGPLWNMLIKNSIINSKNPNTNLQHFDPNEEIGGAILSYLA